MCYSYSHAVAILLIVAFWNWVFWIANNFKHLTRLFILYLVIIVCGVGWICISWPIPVKLFSDNLYNYVYCKEWLPMYWHGFFTNVFHCACMLVFSFDISLSIVPLLIGINSIAFVFYFAEYDVLVLATHAFPNLKEKYLMFISKSGYVDSVKRRADEEGAVLLTIDNMYEI